MAIRMNKLSPYLHGPGILYFGCKYLHVAIYTDPRDWTLTKPFRTLSGHVRTELGPFQICLRSWTSGNK